MKENDALTYLNMKPEQKQRMRPSRVLAKLRAGKIASCYKLNLDSARVAELVALAGFDCIWTNH